MRHFFAMVVIVLFSVSIARANGRVVIPVFPHLRLTAAQKRDKVKDNPWAGVGQVVYGPVRWPTLTEFSPLAAKANGCAMIICPGGAYIFESMSSEGYREARYFSQRGVRCFVLKYRIPETGLPPSGVPMPLLDVRRAVQILRSNAKRWHIDPHRIGIMGFSAGGSVASLAGVHWLPGNPEAKNPLDRFSSRPDFLILGYPLISLLPIGKQHDAFLLLGRHSPMDVQKYFSSQLNVNALTPPSFIFYARNDKIVPHENEKSFYSALRRNGVAAKMIVFQKGGHGFGMGVKGTDSTQWPKDCVRWMDKMGLLR